MSDELSVLDALESHGELTSSSLSRKAKLSTWRLYPALFKLERSGKICSRWQMRGAGMPRRRLYRLSVPEPE